MKIDIYTPMLVTDSDIERCIFGNLGDTPFELSLSSKHASEWVFYDNEAGEYVILTKCMLVDGLKKFLSGWFDNPFAGVVGSDCMRFEDGCLSFDSTKFNGNCANVVLQLGMFGEIVYDVD